LFNALDTVVVDTPAASAISCMEVCRSDLLGDLPIVFLGFGIMK
jgi:hypothetical protein